jgi:hypothetical protein
MGVFLLTAYNHLNDVFKTRTHVDVREKRGVGVGEDCCGRIPTAATMRARCASTTPNDQKPWRDETSARRARS